MPYLFRRGRIWWIGAYIDGQEIRFSTKTKSEEVAGRILSKIETEIAEGRFLDKKRSSTWSLGDLAEHYLARMEQLAPRSSIWRRDRLERALAYFGRSAPIESIDVASLDAFAQRRLSDGKAVSTVRADVRVLRHALRQAYRWRSETGLSEYRLADWKAPRGKAPRAPVFLRPKEVRELLKAAAARADEIPEQRRAEAILRLALETGGRIGELCGITARDFDRGRRTLRLRALKGGLDRSFTLSEPLADAVATLLRTSERPFAGASLPKDRFRKFWHHVREKAGLPHVRFHDLRHTFASEFLRRGAAPRLLQDQLGHRTSRMTDLYSHASPRTRPPAGVVWTRTSGAHSSARRAQSGGRSRVRTADHLRVKDAPASGPVEKPRKATDSRYADLPESGRSAPPHTGRNAHIQA